MKWHVHFEQGGENHGMSIDAPNARGAEQRLKQSYPDAVIVDVEPLDGEPHSSSGASGASAGQGNDPVQEALKSRDAVGPALMVIGVIVILVDLVDGFVKAAHLPDQAGDLAIVASILSVSLYGVVSGLLILGVGAMVTYLFRIQQMMARDRAE
ncbi:hypothetical protein [Thioalkalivibrio sp. ALE19]|uniref:hypothetical protein n=1 Tax=Thioalkalivibrio sp. ALE19 TaxID=1266909 RepID=UPI000412B0B0|nr:hypothetical protein [Thioalkalivibrio sp. ALE19]